MTKTKRRKPLIYKEKTCNPLRLLGFHFMVKNRNIDRNSLRGATSAQRAVQFSFLGDAVLCSLFIL